MDLIWHKTKELLTYYCGYHGNLVTIATRYVADAYCPKEPLCQIWTQYDLRQMSYKAKCIRLGLRLIDSFGVVLGTFITRLKKFSCNFCNT